MAVSPWAAPALEHLTSGLDQRAHELILRGAVAYERDDRRCLYRVHLMVATVHMDHGTWRSLFYDLTDDTLAQMGGLLAYTADHLLYWAMHMPVIAASSVPSQRFGPPL